LRSGCHSKDTFQDKEIEFADDIKFIHKAHFEDAEHGGADLSCDNCHQKITKKQHFEVAKEICFLCHLQPSAESVAANDPAANEGSGTAAGQVIASTGVKPGVKKGKGHSIINFKDGLSKCETCHSIPTKSLQSQIRDDDKDNNPITHQTLIKKGVACDGCHFDIARGDGEVNAGNVTVGGCLQCHNSDADLIAKAEDKQLMHDKHIPTKRADCFECHVQIKHGQIVEHEQYVVNKCSTCHNDPHEYQKILLTGKPVVKDLNETPQLMDEVDTNCTACHIKQEDLKDHEVKAGSARTCGGCHGEEEVRMVKKWKDFLKEEIESTEEIQREAMAAIKAGKPRFDKGVLSELNTKMAEGQKLINIVKLGNGVHNKKYSVEILDAAYARFEEVVDLAGEFD